MSYGIVLTSNNTLHAHITTGKKFRITPLKPFTPDVPPIVECHDRVIQGSGSESRQATQEGRGGGHPLRHPHAVFAPLRPAAA